MFRDLGYAIPGELENNDNLFDILVKILKLSIRESLRKL